MFLLGTISHKKLGRKLKLSQKHREMCPLLGLFFTPPTPPPKKKKKPY